MSEEFPRVTTFNGVDFFESDSFPRVKSSFIVNSESQGTDLKEHRIAIPSDDSYHSLSGEEDLKSKSEGFDAGWIKSWVGNFVWRAMNLAGIGEGGSPVAITKATLSRISVAVAATNLVIDAGKYVIAEYSKNPDNTLADAFLAYWRDPQGFSKTAKEMVVVGLGVVGWTTGYTFMSEAFPSQKILDLVMRALAAGGASGVISGVGTKLAGQDLNTALRTGLQALAEGFVWSMVADKNISNIIDKQSNSKVLGLMADSVTVASTSAAAFGLTGRSYTFFSSQCRSDEAKSHTREDSKDFSSMTQPTVIQEESDDETRQEKLSN